MERVLELNEDLAFTPVYNIDPDPEILDKDFNGFRLLPFETFKERYGRHVQNIKRYGLDFIEPNIAHLSPDYMLVRLHVIDPSGQAVGIKDIPAEGLYNSFANTLLYIRLHTTGDIQFGTFIISYKDSRPYRHVFFRDFVCLCKSFDLGGKEILFKQTQINQDDIVNILAFANTFESKDWSKLSDVSAALASFTRAFGTAEIFYKITNFVTALEFLIIGDNQNTEISYKLRTRLTCLLKDKTLSDFINKMYSLRSSISHTGEISDTVLRKKYDGDVIKLVADVYKLEEICRKTINYYLSRFVEDKDCNPQNIIKEIDKQIFLQLAEL